MPTVKTSVNARGVIQTVEIASGAVLPNGERERVCYSFTDDTQAARHADQLAVHLSQAQRDKLAAVARGDA